MKSFLLVAAKIALPLLVWALYEYRKRAEARKARPRGDEVPFERDYERIEPKATHPDYVHGAGTFILRWGRVAKLAIVFAAVIIGAFVIKEPGVRIGMTITAVLMVLIIVMWAVRQRAAQRG